ncbi:family with sequence similarity 21 [Haematobia irritans]|uniref:family with sequence similarity 21 n=1 Tax=Haematobia irritans TaxID=7368 RepID=UPI003F5014E9
MDDINLEKVINQATEWTFAGDFQLLQWMSKISMNLESKAIQTTHNLDRLNNNVKYTSSQLDNVTNSLTALQYGNQFVECRVQDDDETTITTPTSGTQTNGIKNENQPTQKSLATFLDNNLKLLRNCHEKYSLDIYDSDEENDHVEKTMIFQPINPYNERPLPHIFGSKEWHANGHVGLSYEQKDHSYSGEVSEEFSESSSFEGEENESYETNSECASNFSIANETSNTHFRNNTADYASVESSSTHSSAAGHTPRNIHTKLFSTADNTSRESSSQQSSIANLSSNNTQALLGNEQDKHVSKISGIIPPYRDLFSEPPDDVGGSTTSSTISKNPINLFNDDDDDDVFKPAVVSKGNEPITAESAKSTYVYDTPKSLNANSERSIGNKATATNTIKSKLFEELEDKLFNAQVQAKHSDEKRKNDQIPSQISNVSTNIFEEKKNEATPFAATNNRPNLFDDMDIVSTLPIQSTRSNLFDQKKNEQVPAEIPRNESKLIDERKDNQRPSVTPKFRPNLFDDEDDDDDFLNAFVKKVPQHPTLRSVEPSNPIERNEDLTNERTTKNDTIATTQDIIVDEHPKANAADISNQSKAKHSPLNIFKTVNLFDDEDDEDEDNLFRPKTNIKELRKDEPVEITKIKPTKDLSKNVYGDIKLPENENKISDGHKSQEYGEENMTKYENNFTRPLESTATNLFNDIEILEEEQTNSMGNKGILHSSEIQQNASISLQTEPPNAMDDTTIKEHKKNSSNESENTTPLPVQAGIMEPSITKPLPKQRLLHDLFDDNIAQNVNEIEKVVNSKTETENEIVSQDETNVKRNGDLAKANIIVDSESGMSSSSKAIIESSINTEFLEASEVNTVSVNQVLSSNTQTDITIDSVDDKNITDEDVDRSKGQKSVSMNKVEDRFASKIYDFNSSLLFDEPPDDEFFESLGKPTPQNTNSKFTGFDLENDLYPEPDLPKTPSTSEKVDYTGFHLFSDIPPEDNSFEDSVPTKSESTKHLNNVFYDDFNETLLAMDKHRDAFKNSVYNNEPPPALDGELLPVINDDKNSANDIPISVEKDQKTSPTNITINRPISKLQLPSLNINVQALLPSKPGNTAPFTAIKKGNQEHKDTQSQIYPSSQSESTVVRTPETEHILPSVNKNRVRAPANRRPSTRRARQENYLKSKLENEEYFDNVIEKTEETLSQIGSKSNENISKFTNTTQTPEEVTSVATKNTLDNSINPPTLYPSVSRKTETNNLNKSQLGEHKNCSPTNATEEADEKNSLNTKDLENITEKPKPPVIGKSSRIFLSDESEGDDDLFASLSSKKVSTNKPSTTHPIISNSIENFQSKGVVSMPSSIVTNKPMETSNQTNQQAVCSNVPTKGEAPENKPKTIFGDSNSESDDDLFGSSTSRPSIHKSKSINKESLSTSPVMLDKKNTSLFSDDSDDGNDDFLKTSSVKLQVPKTKYKIPSEHSTSIFSDSDSDNDDLFKTNTKVTKTPLSNPVPKPTTIKQLPMTDNPLADLL